MFQTKVGKTFFIKVQILHILSFVGQDTKPKQLFSSKVFFKKEKNIFTFRSIITIFTQSHRATRLNL